MSEVEKQYLGELNDQNYAGDILVQGNEIRCTITAINADEDDDCNEKNIWVVQNNLIRAGFKDDDQLPDEDRENALREFLKGKLFVFKLYSPVTHPDTFFVANGTLKFIDAQAQYDHYENLPITNVFNRLGFNQRLLNGEPVHIDGSSHFDSNSDFTKLIVHESDTDLNQEVGYLYTNLSVAQRFPDNDNVIFQQPDQDHNIVISKINMNSLNNQIILNANDSIAFVSDEFEDTGLIHNFQINLGAKDSDSDNKLLNQFKDVIQTDKYQLVIDYDDLVNVHTSIKSNLLTVLAGISGTGKSRIVKAYSEALGIKDAKHFKFISVRPFWQDDSDLLGFVDNMSNNYHPGDTGLVETLQKAQSDPDNIYLVTLDEMNLARVEHYFSQFLSVLERDPKDRYINLYDHYLERRLYNSDRYPSSILIPQNVRFIGTMNVDDSTFEFSDKLLDRANVIHLKQQKFTDRNLSTTHQRFDSKDLIPFDYQLYNHNNGFRFNDAALKILWELNQTINNVNPNLGVSWRTVNAIESFIRALPEDTLDVGNEFDWQLASRIFTKLRGTSDMLSNIFKAANHQLSGPIIDIFNEHANISEFKISRRVLLNKAKELDINGFAR